MINQSLCNCYIVITAEDWQKFAYPASEPLLLDKLPEKAFSLWQCLCRLVELVFGDGRDGWTEDMAIIFHKLTLRHNIIRRGFGQSRMSNHSPQFDSCCCGSKTLQ